MYQITNELFVGNWQDAINTASSGTFDAIIYVGQEVPQKLCFYCVPTCYHIPLLDGPNSYDKILSVLTVSNVICKLHKKILIACRAGKSRSMAVAIGVFSLMCNISFGDAKMLVLKEVSEGCPEPRLLTQVESAVLDLKKEGY